jgi:hypothetical protein
MHYEAIPEELIKQMRQIFNDIRADRDKYLNWVKDEIEKLIGMINSFNKVHVTGGIAVRLIQATPTLYSKFLQEYDGPGKEEISEDELLRKDDQVELLLEYVMSIATATSNDNHTIPTEQDIQAIYDQLAKIKVNMSYWEMSADIPDGGNQSDHWLRMSVIAENIHVRGAGYHIHILEIYKELFAPFSDFLKQYYDFDADDLLNTMLRLDMLVFSKVGTPFGATQSHQRLTEWMNEVGNEQIMKTMMETGKHFIQQFTEANPDLGSEQSPDHVVARSLDDIDSYDIIFWVIPRTNMERAIFEKLSTTFGGNDSFFQPAKFKAFILNDTVIKTKPLIKEYDRYYNFSLNLAFRNIFRITENLIKEAGEVFFENNYLGNAHPNTKDNYVERKTKSLFEKLLPNATFYHSLKYNVKDEKGNDKATELDVLGISQDAVYIIEVKAGLLNDKHRRGALKGLKLRLEQTVAEGSYQGHRALTYIQENDAPQFTYSANQTRNTLTIDKSQIKAYYKITVTLEHLSAVAANLKHLITAGILGKEYKWSWVVSLFDLMVFADLIPDEDSFRLYLENRLAVYDRDDIEFSDELDVLGYFMDGNFPLKPVVEGEHIQIVNFSSEIDEYYERKGVGMPGTNPPVFKHKKEL